jgi:hypothetical protein
MLTFTLWPRSISRIGATKLLTSLLVLGLLTLGASGVAATSLATTTAPADDAVASKSDLFRVVLATSNGPITIDHIHFIEQNVVLPDYDAAVVASSTDYWLSFDEIKFLHDNVLLVTRNQSPYGSETITNWLGLSDLELVDESRLHNVVPPSATSIDQSDLRLLDEPGIQPHFGRSRVESIETFRAQNLAEFDRLEQAPLLGSVS